MESSTVPTCPYLLPGVGGSDRRQVGVLGSSGSQPSSSGHFQGCIPGVPPCPMSLQGAEQLELLAPVQGSLHLPADGDCWSCHPQACSLHTTLWLPGTSAHLMGLKLRKVILEGWNTQSGAPPLRQHHQRGCQPHWGSDQDWSMVQLRQHFSPLGAGVYVAAGASHPPAQPGPWGKQDGLGNVEVTERAE